MILFLFKKNKQTENIFFFFFINFNSILFLQYISIAFFIVSHSEYAHILF